MRLHFSFLILISLIPLCGQAQFDPSTELLLRPANLSTPKSSGLESGRYKVKKPSKSLPGKKVSGTEVDSSAQVNKEAAVVIPGTTTTTTTSSTTTSTQALPTTTATLKTVKSKNPEMEKLLFAPKAEVVPAQVVEKSADNVETKPEVEEPAVADQVRDLVMGNEQPVVEAYREQIHPDDIRLNRIELDVLPGVISNSSKSSYSFRNYNTFAPKVLIGAHFWMTPFLGFYGNYTTSMGGDIEDDPSTRSRSTAQHEWSEIGLDIRKFFGMSRKSNSLQFGLHFSEYKFTVPGDDMNRVSLRSSGIGLHLLSRIPVAPSYAWIFGGKIIPRVQHSELGTGISLSSGSTGESTRLDLIFGGEFKMARQNQIAWDITTSFEKNQFGGQADLNDPETGSRPKGVSVENTFVIFSLGYRWGQ
jgi:hypothetical protein